MAISVKNLKGTANLSCGCGSWLKHWENYKNKKAAWCTVVGCNKEATDGSHVKKANSADASTYIAPMCHDHNMATSVLQVGDGALAPANKQKTCER